MTWMREPTDARSSVKPSLRIAVTVSAASLAMRVIWGFLGPLAGGSCFGLRRDVQTTSVHRWDAPGSAVWRWSTCMIRGQFSAGVTGARTCAASLGRRRLSPRRFVALALAWIFLVPALMLHASPTPASALTVPGRS